MQVYVDGVKKYEGMNRSQISTTLTMSSGSRRITVQAADSAKNIFKSTVYATVGTGTSSPLQVTTASVPGANVGNTYSATIAASGGAAPYHWSITSGVLPNGLTLNGSTGAISGTPSTAGNFNFTAGVTDSSSTQQSDSHSFGIAVTASTGNAVNVKQSPYNSVGDGVHDDTANINSAIAALHAGDVLLFPCGTYKTTSQLTINKSVTVDGSGCATIKNSSGGSNIISMSGGGLSATTPLTAFTSDRATTVTANLSAIGASAGDYLVLSEGGRDSSTGSSDTQCDVSGCRGDVVKIQSVSGNTATLVRPLNHPYQSANSPTVRKMLSPLSGAIIQNISLDGGSTASNGISWNYVVNSTMSAVTTKNVVNSGVAGSYGYGNNWVQVTASGCGSPNAGCIDIRYQNNSGYSTISVTANGSGHNFGFAPYRNNDSVFTGITVNQNGSSGRGFKLLANAHNTFSNISVSGTSGGTSTLAVEYYSHHNTFNNCVVKNNQGHAIATFGNFNDHNTFVGCAVTAMAGYKAFSQSASYGGNVADHYTTIQGGTWIGSTGNAVLQMNSSGLTLSGATVKGPGSSGLSLGGLTGEVIMNACVNNNTFSSLPGSSDIYFVSGGGTGNHFNSNGTPDGAYPSPLPTGTCQ